MRMSALSFSVSAAIIAACAIVAAMTASQVRRATRETGLMLAVGARPRSVTISHLLQAAIVGAVGGILGVTLAFPATARLGALVLDAPIKPPPGMLPLVVATCVLSGVVSAALPAIRAGRTDPVNALRED
ncbi:MAG: ABC transporter permease [Deltaproteobacteria bacterium]|nr:ABC transporter permease [Deltaproteobacteria bacterium]